MKLWNHQKRGIKEVLDLIDQGEQRICMTAPCGAGKTTMMRELIEEFVHRGKKVALYTNRRLLTNQTSGVLDGFDVQHGVRASGYMPELHKDVQICSLMTEHVRCIKRQSWELHPADLVLVDECHAQKMVTANNIFGKHIEAGAALVGVTATPLGIGHVYNKLVVAGTNSELRKCGAHVPCITYGPDEPDLTHVRRTVTGEFLQGDVVKAIHRSSLFGRVVKWWRILNPYERPAILFAPGVSESKWFVDQFAEQGICAAHIDGKHIYVNGREHPSTPELRAEILEASRTGEVKILCNRFVLREGVDAPWLYHCIMATPFGSATSYLQAGGRLLRSHKGLKEVILQDHGGCLDTQSEVLTKRGWLGIDDITDSDIVGTMNLETGLFEWCNNQGTIRKDSDSDMVSVSEKSPHLDFRVTGYHEMVMTPDYRGCKWRKTKASDLAARKSGCQIPVSLVETTKPCDLTDSEIAFIGWFFTDGCLDQDRVRIYQSESAPREHHESIVSCLDGCGFRYSVKTRIRNTNFSRESIETCYSVSSGKKSDGGYKRIERWLDKSFPVGVFELLDRRQFGVLLQAMNLGDGCKHGGYNQKTVTLAVARKDAADSIQSLAVRRGYRCNMSTQEQEAGEGRKYSKIFLLHIRDSSHAHIAPGTLKVEEPKSTEKVWCVQTKNGTLICRRHGRVCVMGNSWWRHGSLNEDRHWDLGFDEFTYSAARTAQRKEAEERDPICCVECGFIRTSGSTCPSCGHVNTFRHKNVIQVDGSIKRMTSVQYAKSKAKRQLSSDQKTWYACFFAILAVAKRNPSQKRAMGEVGAYYKRKTGKWPDADIHGVPKNKQQWRMSVLEYNKQGMAYKKT